MIARLITLWICIWPSISDAQVDILIGTHSSDHVSDIVIDAASVETAAGDMGLDFNFISASSIQNPLIDILRSGQTDFAIIPLSVLAEEEVLQGAAFTQLAISPVFSMAAGDLSIVAESQYRFFIESELGRLDALPIAILQQPSYGLLTKTPVASAEDLVGLRIELAADSASTFAVLGASPMALSGDTQSVIAGVSDAIEIDASSVTAYADVVSGGMYVGNVRPRFSAVLANIDFWVELTERERNVFERIFERAERNLAEYSAQTEATALEIIKLKSVDFEFLLSEEHKNAITQNWLKDAGSYGDEVFSLLRRIQDRSQYFMPDFDNSGNNWSPEVYFFTDRQYDGGENVAEMFGIGRSQEAVPACGRVVFSPRNESRALGRPYDGPLHLDGQVEFGDYCTTNFLDHIFQDEQDPTLFIHGFSNDFESALGRAISTKEDLNISGPFILWTWPSLGRTGAYVQDIGGIEFSRPNFEDFLVELARHQRPFNVVSHSMGSRLGVVALEELASIGAAANLFVFIASDVDQSTFRQSVRRNSAAARLITLYAAEDDLALALAAISPLNGEPRAGQAGEVIVVMEPMETIDASLVDGEILGQYRDPDFNHYHALKVFEVVTDLRMHLEKGVSAENRQLIQKKYDDLTYWIIPPATD